MITKKEYLALEAAYTKAHTAGKEQFEHKGQTFYTVCAKSMVEYLKSKFN